MGSKIKDLISMLLNTKCVNWNALAQRVNIDESMEPLEGITSISQIFRALSAAIKFNDRYLNSFNMCFSSERDIYDRIEEEYYFRNSLDKSAISIEYMPDDIQSLNVQPMRFFKVSIGVSNMFMHGANGTVYYSFNGTLYNRFLCEMFKEGDTSLSENVLMRYRYSEDGGLQLYFKDPTVGAKMLGKMISVFLTDQESGAMFWDRPSVKGISKESASVLQAFVNQVGDLLKEPGDLRFGWNFTSGAVDYEKMYKSIYR